ncbi:hypothetical protein [Dasania marina]|uniref:hypothetical protein n=1 Tax=Dasania marina TaxID=471499 RepID=UPI0004BBBDC2|nr:hypothetical protein [Dasania marina]
MLLVSVAVTGCSTDRRDNASSNTQINQQQGRIVLAEKSVINKGAGIKLSYSAEGEVLVGNEVRVALRFTALPSQLIDLQFADNSAFHLLIEKQQQLRTDHNGALNLELVFVPLQAGKMYIKFFSHSQRGGQVVPQVFSIPVYVGDEEGLVPHESSSESQPIFMPANRI